MKIIRYIQVSLWMIPKYRAWRRKKFAAKKLRREKFNNNILTSDQKKEIESFWGRYARFDKIFHAFYTDATGIFRADYIPDSLWYSTIDTYYNPEEKARELDDKSLYSRIFPSNEVSHPENILTKVNGYWISSNNNIISEEEAIDRIFEEDEVFIKISVTSCGGHGVEYFNTKEKSVQDLRNVLIGMGNNIVVQKGIKQSPILAKLNTSSVNTLRIVSFIKKSGEIKIYSSILRMGINGAKVDNASSGGITVGIKEDGQLKEDAYTANGIKYPHHHPDTGVVFSSITIPNFEEIKKLILKLHTYLPQFRLLSWDIALDENNIPLLVEVNMASGELDFHQLNNGPIFGEDTVEVLEEVFGSSGKSR